MSREFCDKYLEGWRYDLFCGNMEREAGRIYQSPFLNKSEQVTYCRGIQIIGALVSEGLPRPLGREFHLSEETLTELRSLLKKIEAERTSSDDWWGGRIYTFEERDAEIIQFSPRGSDQ